MNPKILQLFLILFVPIFLSCGKIETTNSTDDFTDFEVNPVSAKIEFFWQNENAQPFKSLGEIKKLAESRNRKLRFAMNGGIYDKGNVPLGLYVENGRQKIALNTKQGEGNFYLQPNGVFYLTDSGKAEIVKTSDYNSDENVKYATQSGPLLLVERQINPQFSKDSSNLYIRNGVCTKANGNVIFSISRKEITLYNFAEHFLNSDCVNALYLDGFVSRMYLPEKNIEDSDGDFAVIIAVVE